MWQGAIERMLGKALGVSLILLIAVGVINWYYFYTSVIYPLDVAKQWVSRASATNDLKDMANLLTNADAILKNYHGNPGWPFPTPDTDYDQIRTNVEQVIANCQQWNNQTGTSMAYQQAIHNLTDTLAKIYQHLSDANGAIYMNPSSNPVGWILSLLGIAVFVAMIVYAVIGY